MNKKSIRKIDYLTEDKPIPGQTYVCMSFLSPEGIRNCKVRGLKIRGVYGTREAADAQAKQLQSEDPDFHVFVGEVGKWLPWDPDPSSVTDQEYREEELQKLMQAYKKNQESVRNLEEERKKQVSNKAVVDNEKLKTINRIRKKLASRNAEKSTVEEAEDNKQIKDMEKDIKLQEEIVKNVKDELSELKNNDKSVDDDLELKLAKIAELHNNIIR